MGSRAYDTSGSGSSLSKFFPHFSKKADRSGRESGPMVVVIGVDTPAVIEESPDVIHPGPGLSLAVHDNLVPGLRLLLDPLPVTDPADIGEIGRQHIQVPSEFGDRRHPDLIHQGQSNIVLAKKINQGLVEPLSVADFDGIA